jgi:hypothetical protein
MATLVAKNAVPNPKKGEFYFVKNGSVYAVKPNRKGGKKGRTVCVTKKKKAKPLGQARYKKQSAAAKKAAATRRRNAKSKPVTRRKVTRRKSVKKK